MGKIKLIRRPNLDARHTAFAFQHEAVNALKDREYGAVFHEQGLGKTKIAIDLILHWLDKKVVDTVLLVVKKGLIANWERELLIHSHLKPRTLGQNRRANFYVFNSPAVLILTHYEVFKSEKKRFSLFLRTRDVGVILDESTKIKNPDSELTQVFFDLAPLFKRRIILTGTPIANRPEDLWAQVYFLDQGIALGGDFSQFKREVDLSNKLFDDPALQESFEENLLRAHSKLSTFVVRENKESGVISLPQKHYRIILADWEPRQFDLYREVRDYLRSIVIKEGIPTLDSSDEILKRLLRLVQIASNPRLIDDAYRRRPGKLDYLLDLTHHIVQKGEKGIVWTSFTDNVDWLTNQLSNYKAVRVHGKLTMQARNRAIEQFLTDSDVKFLIATPAAAREGLTLTVANHVIFFDRGFSLDDYLQAQDRIHRISQTRDCFIHTIVMPESVDEWIDALIHAKHLAAKLAQGDISLESYRSQMTYDFGEILKMVLNTDAKKGTENDIK
jgi:SNF2 family DNA or RNA helicase